MTKTIAEDVAAQLADMTARGYTPVGTHPRVPELTAGARVHNHGEQYPEAYWDGTATVIAVMRRHETDFEVLVRRDRDGSLGWWADYGTRLAAPSI